jgi:UBX domain-containing protein 7
LQLVNFQSTTQFASHQLNRDTWGDATLKELVRASFVLLQVYDISDEGQKLLGFYKIYELPTIVVVDPLTGAPMRQWTGFKNAERYG